MSEQIKWVTILDFSKYEVSNFGIVRNKRTMHVTSQRIQNGYCSVNLIGDDGKKHWVLVHRVTTKAFILNLENKPTVNHIDRNKSNNHIDNLEWATHSEQRIHIVETDKQNGKKRVPKKFPKQDKYENLIYKPVVGYEDEYEISENADVYSSRSRRHLTVRIFENTRKRDTLFRDGKLLNFLTHVLVATAFIPNLNNLPFVNHIDNNPSNNHFSNLEWVTPSGNMKHAVLTGSVETVPVCQFDSKGKFLKYFISVHEASRDTNNNRGNIHSCIIRRTGYAFIGETVFRKAEQCIYNDETDEYMLDKNLDDPSTWNAPRISKKVCQFDLTGKFISIYDNMALAEKETKCLNISGCCSRMYKRSGKFVFRFVNECIEDDKDMYSLKEGDLPTTKVKGKRGRNVDQYTLDQVFVQHFRTIVDASKEIKMSPTTIFKCCNNKIESAGGYIWKYAD